MQFLNISSSTKLSELSNIVGDRNLEYVLNANQLTRTPNIGKQFSDKCKNVSGSDVPEVDWTRKSALLNGFASSSDVFEKAAISDESEWKIISALGTFANMLKIPDSVSLPNTVDILGNDEHIDKQIYNKAMYQLETQHVIDPAIFNTYSSIKPSKIVDTVDTGNTDVFQYFNIPWGEVTLYSSLDGDSVDFPVYPEELSDSRKANYTTMPDLLYQYEPWQLFQVSGPRSNTYVFSFHRDMWTGDHRDGKANALIRFCEACCYPEYNGSAVNTSTVTLLIAGQPHIVGIITDVSTKWDGPIGLDGWYLHCELSITITEVSTSALSYSSVKNKPLIG